MFAPLLEYVDSIVPMSEEEMLQIKPLLYSRIVKKGDIIVSGTETCDFIAYINKGYFRIFIDHDGKESTIHLAGPEEWISAFYGFIKRTPNRENIQAITDGEIFFIKYEDLQFLFNKSHSIERFGRLLLEKLFVNKERRVISMITDSAEIRYNNLIKEKPNYILNIPLNYIASFIGVTPETLSRIRAK